MRRNKDWTVHFQFRGGRLLGHVATVLQINERGVEPCGGCNQPLAIPIAVLRHAGQIPTADESLSGNLVGAPKKNLRSQAVELLPHRLITLVDNDKKRLPLCPALCAAWPNQCRGVDAAGRVFLEHLKAAVRVEDLSVPSKSLAPPKRHGLGWGRWVEHAAGPERSDGFQQIHAVGDPSSVHGHTVQKRAANRCAVCRRIAPHNAPLFAFRTKHCGKPGRCTAQISKEFDGAEVAAEARLSGYVNGARYDRCLKLCGGRSASRGILPELR